MFPRSSLRAQRSNPESFRGGSLDCFAARAPRNDEERAPFIRSTVAPVKSTATRAARRSRPHCPADPARLPGARPRDPGMSRAKPRCRNE
ncbi:hypothetical protein FXB40_38785 [Bradyrhizobium rifense]|uniref:Uncharacterized protein n=1 Tax=Bradyrhizobium rifense TaxID=515499 RepID=A0A5D3K978_9BRAD|nr:hypothetical protein FXB40_38785 [Bradyrhizobium rifense]